MMLPCHLSSDHSGNVDDDPFKVFTCGAARFVDSASSIRWARIVCCPMPLVVCVHVRPLPRSYGETM
jgi:hypothetical protein